MLNAEVLEGVFFDVQAEEQTPDQLFNQLVERYTSYLYRYAYWRCRNKALAEDLVQETFTRAWKHMSTLRDMTVAKSWLTTILRREHARLYERRQINNFADIQPEDLPGIVNYDTRIEAFVLRKTLARLPEKYREPLILQVLGGFNCKEIASMLGLTEGAVNTRVSRAREKLKRSLSRADNVLKG